MMRHRSAMALASSPSGRCTAEGHALQHRADRVHQALTQGAVQPKGSSSSRPWFREQGRARATRCPSPPERPSMLRRSKRRRLPRAPWRCARSPQAWSPLVGCRGASSATSRVGKRTGRWKSLISRASVGSALTSRSWRILPASMACRPTWSGAGSISHIRWGRGRPRFTRRNAQVKSVEHRRAVEADHGTAHLQPAHLRVLHAPAPHATARAAPSAPGHGAEHDSDRHGGRPRPDKAGSSQPRVHEHAVEASVERTTIHYVPNSPSEKASAAPAATTVAGRSMGHRTRQSAAKVRAPTSRACFEVRDI